MKAFPRLVRCVARRVAVGCSLVAGCCWYAVTTVATSGLAWLVGASALVACSLVAAAGWLVSGE